MKLVIRDFSEIESIEESERMKIKEIHMMKRPSKAVLMQILERFPNLSRITLPTSLYQTLPKNLDLAVEITPGSQKRGRPPKYDKETVQKILTLAESGNSATAISRKLGIPRRTVYHYLNHKRKTIK